jgi:uncharacterized membrane protein YdfJ with MMPL/SSD domain
VVLGVRTPLVPSTVVPLGRWNWWPSGLGSRHIRQRRASAGTDMPDAGAPPRL